MHVFTEGPHAQIVCLSLQNPNDPTILASWRRVAFVDEFFDIIKEVHCREKGHVGSKKTVEEVFNFTYLDIPACITPLLLIHCRCRRCTSVCPGQQLTISYSSV